MLRKMMIALVATTFMGAMAASTTADARMGGGGFRGGGMHIGGGGVRSFSGGGFRTGFAGPRFRTAVFMGRPSIGQRPYTFRTGFAVNRFRTTGFREALRWTASLRVPPRFRTLPPSPGRLRTRAVCRRRWCLWRLMLALATNSVGYAESLGLRQRLWLLWLLLSGCATR